MFKLVKEFIYCLLDQPGSSSFAQQNYIWLRKNQSDKRSLWKGKIIRKLLLIIIIMNLKKLDQKQKQVIYTRAFIQIYNR